MSARVTESGAVSPHVVIAALETALFRGFLVHTAGVTTGKVHDAKVMDSLIRQDDRAVFADTDYVNEKNT